MMRTLTALILLLSWLAAPALAAGTVDVNSAGLSELDSLPGIGPSKAQAIIDYREANGPFTSLDDLDAVKGIGPATLENLAPLVIFSPDGAPAAPSGGGEPAATPSGGGVNINTASQSQLEALPGIGASKAAAIIDYREANGPFASCEALSAVTGIGDATVANLSSSCTVK